MEYLIPLVLVLLIVAGFVTFMVLNATKKSGPVATSDDAPGIGPDETPLGDTTQHAGEQDAQGRTVESPEGGADEPREERSGDGDAAGRIRPGEAEGEEAAPPASERLANREP